MMGKWMADNLIGKAKELVWILLLAKTMRTWEDNIKMYGSE
jgi:hypothetical protein